VSRRRGFTLVEAVTALAVVAAVVLATERLLAASARTAAAARDATRVQLAAQTLLAEARLRALPLGLVTGTSQDGIAFEREVRAADHPALREVRVRTRVDATAGASCELVEVLRAAAVP
jgi:prepilin-type N-terminal cleavage/methylation domain-containing protein